MRHVHLTYVIIMISKRSLDCDMVLINLFENNPFIFTLHEHNLSNRSKYSEIWCFLLFTIEIKNKINTVELCGISLVMPLKTKHYRISFSLYRSTPMWNYLCFISLTVLPRILGRLTPLSSAKISSWLSAVFLKWWVLVKGDVFLHNKINFMILTTNPPLNKKTGGRENESWNVQTTSNLEQHFPPKETIRHRCTDSHVRPRVARHSTATFK